MPPEKHSLTTDPLKIEMRSALIVYQAGKVQQVLASFLRLFLNFRYSLNLVWTRDVIEAALKVHEDEEDICSVFLIQDRPVSSYTTLWGLSNQDRRPIIALVPIRVVGEMRDLCGAMNNVHIWDWERMAAARGPSLASSIEEVFAEHDIHQLFEGAEYLSYELLQKRIARHVDRIDALPTLPQMVLRLMELVNDPDAEIEEIEQVVSADASVVWKLLEIMKSPLFAGLRRSEWTLRDIIVRLGVKKLAAIAQQIKMINSFVRPRDSRFDLRRFWEHSIGAAIVTDHLYGMRKLPLRKPITFNNYWLGALLHDIGKLILGFHAYSHFEQLCEYVDPESGFGIDFHEAEARVGCAGLHEDIGRLLLLHADAGAELVEAVSNHHADGADTSELALLIHVADNLCKDLGFGYLPEERAAYSPSALKKLGVRKEELNEIRDALGDSLSKEIRHITSICLASNAQDQRRATESVQGAGRRRTDSQNRLRELLDQILYLVRTDRSLSSSLRHDLDIDVDAARAQLRRSTLNISALSALVEPLAAVPSLQESARELKRLLDQMR